MATTAAQVFKDLQKNQWKPFYVIFGEEPFQMGEIVEQIKGHFLVPGKDNTFNYEVWDGEHLNGQELLSSLQTLGGLFAEEDSIRLIHCREFHKAPAHALELLEGYFKDPNPSTCFLITASKIDKRKSWYKKVEAGGAVIEVSEPHDREWPKWQSYFEKKTGKKIDLGAWELLVEASGRTLSILWSETEKAATFVGARERITLEDAHQLLSASAGADIFGFAEDVVLKKRLHAMKKMESLVRNGENEIKMLSILVRQFRMVNQCMELGNQGITDPKVVGPKIGSHPFFVTKIQNQAKAHSMESLGRALHLLAESDFRMKTSSAGLFESFLMPYFESAG